MIDKIKEWWEINFNSKDYDPEQPVKLNYAFKEKEPSKRKMRKRINTLEAENELLKETIKDELYKTFMEKLGEPQENARLKHELRMARKKIKAYKELILEESKDKKGKKK